MTKYERDQLDITKDWQKQIYPEYNSEISDLNLRKHNIYITHIN